MAKPKNSFEEMAKVAAARLEEVRAAGQQLTFLPDEAGSAVDLVLDNPVGRPKGAKGKVNNQMRDWLAAKGFQMPEEVLAQMAGLASNGDAVLTAMQNAEMVLAWAYDGATRKKKDAPDELVTPSPSARLNTFIQLYTIQLRAADALLPYGAPKATPDVSVQQSVYVNVPSAPAAGQPGDNARVVSGSRSGRMVPADVAYENEQNQDVSDAEKSKSDNGSRTE